MKFTILIITLLVNASAFAATVSEMRAVEMSAVLASPPVQFLLKQEDGIGNIEGISFVPSTTEISNYEIRFTSHAGFGVPAACTVLVKVNGTQIAAGRVKCKEEAQKSEQPEKVCAHPSPIGCKD